MKRADRVRRRRSQPRLSAHTSFLSHTHTRTRTRERERDTPLAQARIHFAHASTTHTLSLSHRAAPLSLTHTHTHNTRERERAAFVSVTHRDEVREDHDERWEDDGERVALVDAPERVEPIATGGWIRVELRRGRHDARADEETAKDERVPHDRDVENDGAREPNPIADVVHEHAHCHRQRTRRAHNLTTDFGHTVLGYSFTQVREWQNLQLYTARSDHRENKNMFKFHRTSILKKQQLPTAGLGSGRVERRRPYTRMTELVRRI